MKPDIQVFIVECDHFARQGIKFLLARDSRTRVVGELNAPICPEQAYEGIAQADVLLIANTALPSGPSAASTIAALSRKYPKKKIMILYAGGEEFPACEVALAGATSLLIKNEVQDGIASAIVRAAKGLFVVTPSVVPALNLATLGVKKRVHVLPPGVRFMALTKRIDQVTNYYAAGMSALQIADELKLAPSTIGTYFKIMHQIIGVSDRWQIFTKITALVDEIESEENGEECIE